MGSPTLSKNVKKISNNVKSKDVAETTSGDAMTSLSSGGKKETKTSHLEDIETDQDPERERETFKEERQKQ